MEDNIDCSPETAVFSDGYKAGWKARGEYIRDHRTANTGTSFGLAIMMLNGMVFVLFAVIPIFAPVIVERVVIVLIVVGALIGVGYFINKAENKSFDKKQAAFKEKWGE